MTATNPLQIIFNHSDVPVSRRLLVRNSTNQDYVVKVVPSSKTVVQLDNRQFLVRAKNYAVVNVTVDPRQISLFDNAAHSINIYARAFNIPNFASLKQWVTEEGVETVKQRVRHLTIKVSKDYSARDTVVDVPGDAQPIDPVQWASLSTRQCPLDNGTTTAVRFDADTKTAAPIDSADNKYFFPQSVNQATLFASLQEWLTLPKLPLMA